MPEKVWEIVTASGRVDVTMRRTAGSDPLPSARWVVGDSERRVALYLAWNRSRRALARSISIASAYDRSPDGIELTLVNVTTPKSASGFRAELPATPDCSATHSAEDPA